MRARRSAGGFTLIEVALVVLIVSVLLAMAAPRLHGLTRARIDAAAERTRAVVAYLNDEAALRGRIYRFTVDDDGGGWSIRALSPWTPSAAEPEFQEIWDPVARDTRIESGVRIAELRLGERRTGGNDSHVYFTPDGVSEDLQILLEGEEENRTIELNAATGIARIMDPGLEL